MSYGKLSDSELDELIKLREWRLCQDSLLEFTKLLFTDVYGEQTPFIENWHHRVICEELEKVVTKKRQRIMIFVPPQYSKSLFSSRFLPAWVHTHNPDEKVVGASYSATLSDSFNRDYQQILNCPKYRELFPEIKIGSKEGKKKATSSLAELAGRNGYYLSSSVGGSLTGRTADILILDDLFSGMRQADSKAYRSEVDLWYRTVARTRLSKKGSIVILFTRWHPEDLAGVLLRKAAEDPAADQWNVIKIPLLAEGKLHHKDPRKAGEPLWPAFKEDLTQIKAIQSDTPSREFQAVYQQNPIIIGGNMIKEEWLQRYRQLPVKIDRHFIVADLRFGKKADSGSFVVYQCWAIAGHKKFLVDQVRGRWGYSESKKQFLSFCKKHPKAKLKYIEQKANGEAMEDELCSIVLGIKFYNPSGDKVSRVHYIEDELESGAVHLPDEPWVDKDLIPELTTFPQAPHDDQTDCLSMALAISKEKSGRLEKAKKLANVNPATILNW